MPVVCGSIRGSAPSFIRLATLRRAHDTRAISAALVGLTVATHVRGATPVTARGPQPQRAAGATLLTAFALGCPICNKLVVGLIGVSGALNYWAPLQPIPGVFSVALLMTGLLVRPRGAVACPVPIAA